LQKAGSNHDPRDRIAALTAVAEANKAGDILTGLLYIDPEAEETHQFLNTTASPLNALAEKELCPGSAALERINASLR